MIRYRILLFALLLLPFSGPAQSPFGAGIVVGFNASQIQGDDSAGFNRLGVRAGVRGLARLSEKTELGFDLLYSQRGSTTELVPNNNFLRFVIHLDYVEVPIWFAFKDGLSPEGYYRWKALGGISYGRLFNARMVDHPTFPEDQIDNFNSNDLSLILGITYQASKKFSMGIQYTRSVVPLYNNRKFLNNVGLPIYRYRLWGYLLSFQGVFEF